MQCPGVMEMTIMTRKNVEPTTRPGVRKLDAGRYLIRVKVQHPDGRTAEAEREITARSPADADAQRHQVRLELLARLEADHARSHTTRSDVSVSEYALAWLDRTKVRLRPSTRSRYADAIAKLNVGLGHMRVRDVRKADVETWRNGLTGAPDTVNGELAVVRSLFADAVENLGLTRSPAGTVQGLERHHTESRKAFTAQELVRVLDALRADAKLSVWYPLVLTLTLTGARFGEASALRWTDIDDANGVITIQRAHWRGTVGHTKTRKVRTVALHPELARVLRDHRRALIASQHPHLATGYAFPSERTELHTQASPLGRVLRKACQNAHVEPPGRLVHALRRAFNDAVRKVAEGDVVRAMTGHVTAAMTSHYSTIQHDEKRVAVNAAFAFLHPPLAPGGETSGE